jgi:CRISPR-associated exonuclease Cas4
MLINDGNQPAQPKSIILAIEEPELYIHPQLQRIVFNVLKEFASTEGNQDQIIYSTHSPAFVDVWEYHKICVVRKEIVQTGTKVYQCDEGILEKDGEDKKNFQLLNSFGTEKNLMFFAKHTVLVEGEQDGIAVIATGRALGLFRECTEELGISIIDTDGKQEMPKYERLLNAFGLPFTVLLELDDKDERHKDQSSMN